MNVLSCILFTWAGIIILSNFSQVLKAYAPIVSTLSGNSTLNKFVHFSNEYAPILLRLDGRSILDNCMHSLNADKPIFVSPETNLISVNRLHFVKAPSPIVVMLSESEILFNLEHFRKQYGFNSVRWEGKTKLSNPQASKQPSSIYLILEGILILSNPLPEKAYLPSVDNPSGRFIVFSAISL